jgi:predicted dienelactone hydrolase
MRIPLAVVAATILAGCAAAPTPAIEAAQNAGFTIVAVSDPQDKPIEVAIWYPTRAAPAVMDLGLYRQNVARDAPIAGRDLPLVVISHGTGGGWVSHADTAVALASAGFVVAAPTHTGDNYRDDSYVGTSRWLPERARQVKRVIDYMQDEWKGRDRLDGRVGMFGFSAGAFTTLVMIGGVPDMALVDRHCRESPELACTLWKEPAQSASPRWIHDPRISAAVVAAPGLGFTFELAGLSQVTAAVQLWGAGDDRVVRYATNTALVRRQLPSAEYHDVPRAGHMSFIVPCAGGPPPLCSDAEGFDRAAFHAELNRDMAAFFRARLEKR